MVYGMMATRNESRCESHTVSDTPLTVTLPSLQSHTLLQPCRVDVIGELEIGAAVDFSDVGADSCAIHMPLDDMAVKTAVHEHTAFEID